MFQRLDQKWLVGTILLLCLLSLPFGWLGQEKHTSHPNSNEKSSTPFSLHFQDHIQVIRLSGIIADGEENPFSLADESAYSALKQLRKATKDDHIKGILLRINSPGGTVPASQEISDAVDALQQQKKVVVISMGDVAASGAYYISSQADSIVAEPGTLTGSIGVIINGMNFKKLGDKLGLEPEVIKSGKFKDLASPFRPMTAEDRSILQGLIEDSYDQFVSAVAKGRKMSIATVKKLADGRVYSGQQAHKLGLVDKLGSYDTSIDVLQSMCKERFGLSQNLPVQEAQKKGVLSSLLDSSSTFLNLMAGLKLQRNTMQQLMPQFTTFSEQPMWVLR